MRWTGVVCVAVLAGCFQPVSENIVGPEGGELHFSGAALRIPPGALDYEVPFSATPIELPGDAPRALGPAFQFRPEGLTFHQPLELTLRLDAPSPNADVLTAPSTQGPWQRLPARVVDGLAQVSVTHFSVYYPTEPLPDAGQPDAGKPDAGEPDAGFDAGREAGTPDAGRVCFPACSIVGSACDSSSGRCVFGYQSLRIVEPVDGKVVRRNDAGTATAIVELTPIPGLAPFPPPELQGLLLFVISNTWPTFLPVADGGPYVTTFPVHPMSGAPYELQVSQSFPEFAGADGGHVVLRDVVHFSME